MYSIKIGKVKIKGIGSGFEGQDPHDLPDVELNSGKKNKTPWLLLVSLGALVCIISK